MVTYLQGNRMLNREFNGVDYTPPTAYYIGLSTAHTNPNGTGSAEPIGGSYTRLKLNKGTVDFTASTMNMLTNKQTISFPKSTNDWGNILDVVVYDDLTLGNVLFYETLVVPRPVPDSTTLSFDIGSLQFKMTSV